MTTEQADIIIRKLTMIDSGIGVLIFIGFCLLIFKKMH
jgi:hypothetical protein